jgi:dihydrofolate reductase
MILPSAPGHIGERRSAPGGAAERPSVREVESPFRQESRPPIMRKLIVCNIVSLDGFFSGPGGDVMAMPFDRGFSDYNAERLRAADTLLLGRKSYEGFRSYWPAIAEDVNQPAVEREISRLNGAIEKVVVSNSLKPDDVEGWGPTRVVRRTNLYADVATLKEGPGREILIFGSHVLWNDLLAHGLVDELHFMIGAGVLGEGVRVFETRPPGSLRLVDTRTFDASSLLLAQYAVEP